MSDRPSKPERIGKVLEDVLASSVPQLPRNQIVQDMTEFIARMPLTDAEANTLYDAIRKRVPSKSCGRCSLLKCVGFEGSAILWRGFGKVFLCVGCQAILREKGQIEE